MCSGQIPAQVPFEAQGCFLHKRLVQVERPLWCAAQAGSARGTTSWEAPCLFSARPEGRGRAVWLRVSAQLQGLLKARGAVLAGPACSWAAVALAERPGGCGGGPHRAVTDRTPLPGRIRSLGMPGWEVSSHVREGLASAPATTASWWCF